MAAPASVLPELSGRPRRRTFTARGKLRILAATDRAAETGGIGPILRREGIYSSTLCDWRRQKPFLAVVGPVARSSCRNSSSHRSCPWAAIWSNVIPSQAGGTVVTPACPVEASSRTSARHTLSYNEWNRKSGSALAFALQRGLSFLNSFERSCWAIGQSPRSHHFSRLAQVRAPSLSRHCPASPVSTDPSAICPAGADPRGFVVDRLVANRGRRDSVPLLRTDVLPYIRAATFTPVRPSGAYPARCRVAFATHDICAPWQGAQWNKIEHCLFATITMNWRGSRWSVTRSLSN